MSYTISTLDDGHIVLFEMNTDFSVSGEMPQALQDCYDCLESGPDPIVIVVDTSKASNRGFDDVVQGANSVRAPIARKMQNHPKLIANVTVIANRMIHLAVMGINSAAFGFVKVLVYPTQEEAIAQARVLLIEKSREVHE